MSASQEDRDKANADYAKSVMDIRDAQWARAIADAMDIPIGDALARVRRIIDDPDLYEVVKDTAARLGGSTVITDARRDPQPNGLPDNVTIATAPHTGVKNKALQKAPIVSLLEDTARRDMREHVARFEMDRTFGKPKTSLSFLMSLGLA